MDQETKDYLDAKFATIDDQERKVREFVEGARNQAQVWRKRMLPLSLAIIVFMLGFQALLFWYLGLWG